MSRNIPRIILLSESLLESSVDNTAANPTKANPVTTKNKPRI